MAERAIVNKLRNSLRELHKKKKEKKIALLLHAVVIDNHGDHDLADTSRGHQVNA